MSSNIHYAGGRDRGPEHNKSPTPPLKRTRRYPPLPQVSNLCTQFVDDCCISDDVEEYCDNPRYAIRRLQTVVGADKKQSSMTDNDWRPTFRSNYKQYIQHQAIPPTVYRARKHTHTHTAHTSDEISERILSATGRV